MCNRLMIIAKVTHRCNLRCSYCYLRDHDGPSMSLDTLDQVAQLGAAQALHRVTFLWHGGEPLAMGLDFYRAALLATRSCHQPSSLRHYLQTNGTLITPEVASFLADNHFKVGLSIDGPMHDSCRRTVSNEGSVAAVKRGIGYLHDAGVRFGVLAVLQPNNPIDIQSFYTFMNDLGAQTVKVQPLYGLRCPPSWPSQFRDMINTLLEMWIHDSTCATEWEPFVSIAKSFVTGGNTGCMFRRTCLGGEFLSVDPRGDVYLCGRLEGGSAPQIGSVAENLAVLRSRALCYHRERDCAIADQCGACRYYRYCFGGCAAEGFFLSGGLTQKTPFCDAYHDVFSRLEAVTEEIRGRMA